MQSGYEASTVDEELVRAYIQRQRNGENGQDYARVAQYLPEERPFLKEVGFCRFRQRNYVSKLRKGLWKLYTYISMFVMGAAADTYQLIESFTGTNQSYTPMI